MRARHAQCHAVPEQKVFPLFLILLKSEIPSYFNVDNFLVLNKKTFGIFFKICHSSNNNFKLEKL